MNIFTRIKNYILGKNKKNIPFEIIHMGKKCKCFKCANFYNLHWKKKRPRYNCISYPGRIPEEILKGEVQHDKPRGDERYFGWQDVEGMPCIYYNENYVTNKTIFDFNPTKEELEELMISISKRKYIKEANEWQRLVNLKTLFQYRGEKELYYKYSFICKIRNPYFQTGYTDVVTKHDLKRRKNR